MFWFYILTEITVPTYIKLSTSLNSQSDDFVRTFLEGMTVHRDFITDAEEKSILEEIEPYLKRMRYEFDHWDDVSYHNLLQNV